MPREGWEAGRLGREEAEKQATWNGGILEYWNGGMLEYWKKPLGSGDAGKP